MLEAIAITAGTVAALALVFLRGASSGKNKAEQEATKEVLQNVETAKKINDDVAAMPADDRREQLRKYAKK